MNSHIRKISDIRNSLLARLRFKAGGIGLLLLLPLVLTSCIDPFKPAIEYPMGPEATLKWKLDANQGVTTYIQRAAATAAGLVFFITEGSCLNKVPSKYQEICLYAVDQDSGQIEWQLAKNARAETDVVASDGLLYFGATLGSAHLFAIDPHTGTEKWELELGTDELEQISVQGNSLYVSGSRLDTAASSYKDVLYVFDKRTGEQLWRFDVTSWDQLSYTASVDLVYLGYRAISGKDYSRGYVQALDAKTGQEKWQIPVADIVNGNPLLDGGRLYVSSNLALYVLDARSGVEIWRYTISDASVGPLAVDANNIYYDSCAPIQVYVSHCKLIAIGKQTQKPVWELETESDFAAPVVQNGVIYLAINHGIVYAVDPTSGAVLWLYETGDTITARVSLNEQTLFVGNWLGTLYAIPLNSPARK